MYITKEKLDSLDKSHRKINIQVQQLYGKDDSSTDKDRWQKENNNLQLY